MTIRTSRPDDAERVIEIWQRAVEATHDFLAPSDRSAIEEEVRSFLPQAPLWIAADDDDLGLGFMLLDGSHLEALFVDPACHRQGIGSRLLTHAWSLHGIISVDVNEANTQAAEFYRQHGFVEIGRSDRDSQRRPYPLLHLRRQGPMLAEEIHRDRDSRCQ
jgi:putative acetyltransferase